MKEESIIFGIIMIFLGVVTMLIIYSDKQQIEDLKQQLRISEGQKDTIMQDYDKCMEWVQ